MPWHRSISNPRKVYNERHEQVCICETPEQAALIVEAVRAFVPPAERDSLIMRNVAIKIPMPPGASRPRVSDPADDDGSFAIV